MTPGHYLEFKKTLYHYTHSGILHNKEQCQITKIPK